MNVVTEAPFVADKVFEDFESPPAFTYTTISGTLTKGVPNPLVNSVNPSPKVGKYLRNAGAFYDVHRVGVGRAVARGLHLGADEAAGAASGAGPARAGPISGG